MPPQPAFWVPGSLPVVPHPALTSFGSTVSALARRPTWNLFLRTCERALKAFTRCEH